MALEGSGVRRRWEGRRISTKNRRQKEESKRTGTYRHKYIIYAASPLYCTVQTVTSKQTFARKYETNRDEYLRSKGRSKRIHTKRAGQWSQAP